MNYKQVVHRKVYINNAEKYRLRIDEYNKEATEFSDDYDYYAMKEDVITKEDSYKVYQSQPNINAEVATKINVLNKKRSVHLKNMQTEAMELLLEEIKKYV